MLWLWLKRARCPRSSHLLSRNPEDALGCLGPETGQCLQKRNLPPCPLSREISTNYFLASLSENSGGRLIFAAT